MQAAENMRDFLVVKLRNAELTLKLTLGDLVVLRQQKTVDQVVSGPHRIVEPYLVTIYCLNP